MDAFRVRLLTLVIAFGLILGAGAGLLLYYVFPQFYPNWYLGIVFFFLVIELVAMNFVITSSRKASSKKMVNVYMMAKVIKMLASLMFVTIYYAAVKENIKSFILVFIVFYALYLGFETYLFSKVEKELKEEKK